MQAQRATGAYNGHILKVCRGERKTHKGFIWKFGHTKSDELLGSPKIDNQQSSSNDREDSTTTSV